MSEQNMNGWINENENIPVEKTDEVRETAAETVSDVSGNPGPAVQQSGYQAQMNQAAGAQQGNPGGFDRRPAVRNTRPPARGYTRIRESGPCP